MGASVSSEQASSLEVKCGFVTNYQIFLIYLDSLRDGCPKRLTAVREEYTFKLCLHCIAYRITVCRYLMDTVASNSKHRLDLTRLGMYPAYEEEVISRRGKEIGDVQTEMAKLTEMLDQARQLGLNQDVTAITRACEVNMEARRLAGLAQDNVHSGQWVLVVRYIAEIVTLLNERHTAWPSWSDLDKKRQQTTRPVKMYECEDKVEVGKLVLDLLHSVSCNLPVLPAGVFKYVKFHSKDPYQEFFQTARFIAEHSVNREVRAAGMLTASDDEEFCELGIRQFGDFRPPLVTHYFGLCLYRLCLRVEKWKLADIAMKMRFMNAPDPDEEQVIDLLNQLLTELRRNPLQPKNGIASNTERDDTVCGYELPELMSAVEEIQEHAWWEKVFRERNRNVWSAQDSSMKVESASSDATTVDPSSSYSRRLHNLTMEERTHSSTASDPMAENRKVALLFSTKSRMCDNDTYSIFFSPVTVAVKNPITLRWKVHNGDQEKKTNITIGKLYHCQVLTYQPDQDEWSARPDMCRLSSPLTVEQEGATRAPFLGDCGEWLEDDMYVFKIHKSMSYSSALQEYMADVRTQSTAAWYVNRFNALTQNKFGVLDMLRSELVLVYQDSRRNTILELMTRELLYKPVGNEVKFDKYTSNASWRNKGVSTDVWEAFSHFTHHDSEGTVMVTDLQGWVGWDNGRSNIIYTLTDPAIHCPGEPYRFGGTNFRHEGFDQFFQHVHTTCNHICESLSLTRPEEFCDKR